MSLGILVVATSDAVYGMGLEVSEGIILVNKPLEMAEFALDWLSNKKEINRQSPLGRRQMERKFSYEPKYKRFTQQLYDIVNIKGGFLHPLVNTIDRNYGQFRVLSNLFFGE